LTISATLGFAFALVVPPLRLGPNGSSQALIATILAELAAQGLAAVEPYVRAYFDEAESLEELQEARKRLSPAMTFTISSNKPPRRPTAARTPSSTRRTISCAFPP
jgi:hypothetical protein